MDILIEIIGDIIPLILLIGIPVLRGLNNSQKQKREFEEKKRKATYNPSTREEANVGSWRSIITEIEKELNKEKKKKEKKKVTSNSMEANSTNTSSEVNKPQAHSNEYQEEIFYNDTQEHPMDGVDLYNNSKEELSESPTSKGEIQDVQDDLVFSSNPIIQGMIFSEILGPPKSRR